MPTIYENDFPTRYPDIFKDLGHSKSLSEDLAKELRKIRESVKGEITAMQQLVSEMHPHPNYLVYTVSFKEGLLVTYGAATLPSLTEALILINNGTNGDRFAADSRSQIVAADVSAKIPDVATFAPVIAAPEVHRLPPDHPAVRLYSFAQTIISRVDDAGALNEDISILLAEGLNEKIVTDPAV